MNTLRELNNISGITASELLTTMGINNAPVDVFALAKSLPITVDDAIDMVDRVNLSGEIKLDDDRKPVIWVNPLDTENRQRFTMAHEVAHLVNDIIPNLDRVGVDDEFHDSSMNLKRDGRQDPKEFAANEFAAQLLMPYDFIANETQEIIKNIKEQQGEKAKVSASILIFKLASKFEVSEQAMSIRLRRIGIIQ